MALKIIIREKGVAGIYTSNKARCNSRKCTVLYLLYVFLGFISSCSNDLCQLSVWYCFYGALIQANQVCDMVFGQLKKWDSEKHINSMLTALVRKDPPALGLN